MRDNIQHNMYIIVGREGLYVGNKYGHLLCMCVFMCRTLHNRMKADV